MTQGRKRRIFGALIIALGGLLTAVVTLVQWAAYTNVETFTSALRATLQVAGILGTVATVIFVIGLVVLATAHGPAGPFDGSRLPTAGFIVLAVVFGGAQLFFRLAPYFYTASTAENATLINRGINIAIIVAILIAAIAMLVTSPLAVVPRVALFLPALALIVIQFPFPVGIHGYLLPQVAFHLTWVVVGVLYLLARPRPARVTAGPESLAE